MIYNLRSIGLSLMQNSGVKAPSLDTMTVQGQPRPGPPTPRHQVRGRSQTPSRLNNQPKPLVSHHSEAKPKPANQSQQHMPSSSGSANQKKEHTATSSIPKASNKEDTSDGGICSKSPARKKKMKKRKKARNTREERSDTEPSDDLDLTVGYEEVMILGGDTYSRNNEISVNNTSNNSDSSISLEFVEDGQPGANKVCTVLNCEAEFSSEGRLGQHMNLFQHSPCHPCRKVTDCKLSPDPLCFMCPKCDREFQTADECQEHMREKSHLQFFPPLSVCGYLCSQCLNIFPSFQVCWEHIEHNNHHDICYPFAEDHKAQSLGPVAVVEELAQDMIKKCEKISFSVQCLECLMDIENPASLRQHLLETNNLHVVSVLSDMNVVDVFASYLAGYICDTCCRLFSGELKEAAKHQCARGITGTVVENCTQSFTQFVKYCALTLIKSVDVGRGAGPSNHPKPGTSQCKRFASDRDHETEARGACGGPYVMASPRKKLRDRSREESTGSPSRKTPCSDSERWESSMEISDNEASLIILNDSDLDPSGGAIKKTYSCVPKNSKSNKNSPSKKPALLTSDQDSDVLPKATQSGSGKHPSATVTLSSGNHSAEKPEASPETQTIVIDDIINPEHQEPSEKVMGTQEYLADRPGPSRERIRPGLIPVSETQVGERRDRSRSPLTSSLISTENLVQMKNIIFLDLDNWPGFFSKLPRSLPDLTFVWGFFGGRVQWREPRRCYIFNQIKQKGQFYLNEQCGFTKDAADFAIVLTVGKMDERLPSHIAFTIMSGDKGFCEVERQMKTSVRKAVVINPHSAEQFSNDMIYAMVTSVTDT